MYNNLLAHKLKALRKNQNMNQDDVAAELGIARQTYSNYETGKRVPNSETLSKIADLYHISVVELLSPAVTGADPKIYENAMDFLDAQELDEYLEYTRRAANKQRMSVLSHYEKQLIYYFEQLSQDDKEEIIELAKLKNRRRKNKNHKA